MAKFRKRMSIAPGVKLNLSKSGVSLTGGVKGASVNVGKNGAFLNTGIPGTGIYDRKKLGGGKGGAEGGYAATESGDADRQTGPVTLASVVASLLGAVVFISFGVFSFVTDNEIFGPVLGIFSLVFGGLFVLIGGLKIWQRKRPVSASPAKPGL